MKGLSFLGPCSMRKNEMKCFRKRVASMIWGAKSQESGEIRAQYLPLERTLVYLSKEMLSSIYLFFSLCMYIYIYIIFPREAT